jgi:uncharacterized membrane protein YbaN (DUF454 family)
VESNLSSSNITSRYNYFAHSFASTERIYIILFIYIIVDLLWYDISEAVIVLMCVTVAAGENNERNKEG